MNEKGKKRNKYNVFFIEDIKSVEKVL